MKFNKPCPVCGGGAFLHSPVLWDELINDWELTPMEVEYIERQQGSYCSNCYNNFRSMSLANALLINFDFQGVLEDFVCDFSFRDLNVLEINKSGNLSSTLSELPGHKLIEHPDIDMMDLDFEDNSIDLIIHSDTLEHVPNPKKGLSECLRVLKKNGRCIFTVPIIVGRLSRTRDGMKKSYHGSNKDQPSDYIVHTEFGADVWCLIIKSGFENVQFISFDYPSAIAIIATKL